MTAVLAATPILRFVDNDGNALVGGQLFSYQAGTLQPIPTYVDSSLTVPNSNPIILNSRGEVSLAQTGQSCGLWTPPNVAYKFSLYDANNNLIWGPVDNIISVQTPITQSLVAQALNPITDQESEVGVAPVNYQYGTYPYPILRLAADPTGQTDSSGALQGAINVALSALGSGAFGVSIYVPAGAYLINTPPTFGPATTAMLPITIFGDGEGTQFIHNAPSGSGALFNMAGRNGWTLRDFLICGNDAHQNDGIYAGVTGSSLQVRWRIARVTVMMAGQGLRIADTNNGQVYQFRSWPNNPPNLIVPQTVTRSNIKEQILCTGSFVNLVTFRDCETPCSTNFGAAAFSMNCADCSGVIIDGLDVETYDGTQGTGLLLQPTSFGIGLQISNVYCETSFCQFSNIQNSHFGPFTDGNVGGVFDFQSTCRQNLIVGVNVATIQIIDAASTGNIFLGCQGRTAFVDNSEGANLSGQPNRYIGCGLFATSFKNTPDLGDTWRKLLPISSNVANPDTYTATWNVLRVTASTLTINAPLNPRNGQRVGFTVRNETVSTIAVTWVGFSTPPWTNPAAGFNRSAEYMYDSDFSVWRQLWYSGADVLN